MKTDDIATKHLKPARKCPLRHSQIPLLECDWALAQLWLFRVEPIAGAVLAGLAYRWRDGENDDW